MPTWTPAPPTPPNLDAAAQDAQAQHHYIQRAIKDGVAGVMYDLSYDQSFSTEQTRLRLLHIANFIYTRRAHLAPADTTIRAAIAETTTREETA